MNPARCLPLCAMDPSPHLVRVNRTSEPDEQGTILVLEEAQGPLQALIAAARDAGHRLRINTGYRSYEEQALLFQRATDEGRVARPGHSEHQLGSALDLHLPTGAALAWLDGHAVDFGFALSYPAGQQRLTGYRPEPWHIRFIGAELAGELRSSGLTLEALLRARPDLGESGAARTARARPPARLVRGSWRRGAVGGTCWSGATMARWRAWTAPRPGSAAVRGRRACTTAWRHPEGPA